VVQPQVDVHSPRELAAPFDATARAEDKAMTQLGLGLYTLADAGRLIHAKSPAIKRWLYGYSYTSKNGGGRVRRLADPLWTPQYVADDFNEKIIGFQDLLELRIVHEFVRRGVPLLAGSSSNVRLGLPFHD
jgi:hypothetical protein